MVVVPELLQPVGVCAREHCQLDSRGGIDERMYIPKATPAAAREERANLERGDIVDGRESRFSS